MSKEENELHDDVEKEPKAVDWGRRVEILLAAMALAFTGIMAVLNYCQYGAYREFSQTELRAYVYATDFLSDVDVARGFPFGRVSFNFKNVGATPAINVRGWAGLAYLDKQDFAVNLDTMDVTDDPSYIIPSHSAVAAFVELPPGVVVTTKPAKRLYLYGKYRYEDAFGDVHTEQFYYEYIHAHKRFLPYVKQEPSRSM